MKNITNKILPIILIALAVLSGCDKPHKTPASKYSIVETYIYTPTKVTVDLELLQQGIVVYETVLEQHEITDIAYRLYAEDVDWRVEGQNPSGHTHPHQISQFIYKYNGYTIDIRTKVILIRIGL